jgi:3-phenylpropionate/cinnamic acid dioxygenase small subunit
VSDHREDQAQISDVLIRYATGIDQRDWPLFRTCWTADVDVDYGDIGTFSGVDAITGFMARMHDGMGPTHHFMSNFVIDVEGGHAAARSYVHAILVVTQDDSANWIDVLGNYADEFVRTVEGWRIRRRTARMARMLTGGAIPTA